MLVPAQPSSQANLPLTVAPQMVVTHYKQTETVLMKLEEIK
jgi:hypothetical protein